MPDAETSLVARRIVAAMRDAAHAAMVDDLDRMVEGLRSAMILYEQYPSLVHSRAAYFDSFVVLIASARSICARLGQPDRALAALADRAHALSPPLH